MSPYGLGSDNWSNINAIPPFWKAVSIETAVIWATFNLKVLNIKGEYDKVGMYSKNFIFYFLLTHTAKQNQHQMCNHKKQLKIRQLPSAMSLTEKWIYWCTYQPVTNNFIFNFDICIARLGKQGSEGIFS